MKIEGKGFAGMILEGSGKIEDMRCEVCGNQAAGYNINGPFCANREHYILSLQDWPLRPVKYKAIPSTVQ